MVAMRPGKVRRAGDWTRGPGERAVGLRAGGGAGCAEWKAEAIAEGEAEAVVEWEAGAASAASWAALGLGRWGC